MWRHGPFLFLQFLVGRSGAFTLSPPRPISGRVPTQGPFSNDANTLKGMRTLAFENCARHASRALTNGGGLRMTPFAIEEFAADPAKTLDTMLPAINVASANQFNLLNMDTESATALAGPLFGASIFPYLAFLFFLSREENQCPKGVTVGFASLLIFVFLTIPAAIASEVLYGVSLADCDWLHGSAESLLTITNLVTVLAFRQALTAREQGLPMPSSATSYVPTLVLAGSLIALATATCVVPALGEPSVHTPYLGGFMDLPYNSMERFGAFSEPENALTVACWIIHVTSIVEFLVAMGFAWKWADVVGNSKWKGLTWGLLPLHSSGLTACTYHIFYNGIPVLVPLQALLTCFGNATAAFAAYRIARSNGWKFDAPSSISGFVESTFGEAEKSQPAREVEARKESSSLVGFEDLGETLSGVSDYSFIVTLFLGCAAASYAIKYGETFFSFPYDANVFLGLAFIGIPSALNAFKWWKRSSDPSFEGWF